MVEFVSRIVWLIATFAIVEVFLHKEWLEARGTFKGVQEQYCASFHGLGMTVCAAGLFEMGFLPAVVAYFLGSGWAFLLGRFEFYANQRFNRENCQIKKLKVYGVTYAIRVFVFSFVAAALVVIDSRLGHTAEALGTVNSLFLFWPAIVAGIWLAFQVFPAAMSYLKNSLNVG